MSQFDHALRRDDALLSRRELLCRGGMGMGALMLADLMGQAFADDAPTLSPLAPRKGHFPGRAKRVIHIFANGGSGPAATSGPDSSPLRDAGDPPAPGCRKGRDTKGE